MLIKNTEPMTFARLTYHNTKLLTRGRPSATLRTGGVIIAFSSAWAGVVIAGVSALWMPVTLAAALLTLLLCDTIIGVMNTLTELRVLDTLEDTHDYSREEGEEESEPGEEDGGDDGSAYC